MAISRLTGDTTWTGALKPSAIIGAFKATASSVNSGFLGFM